MQGVEDLSLEPLISRTTSTALQPLCFFVSWQGVLTLAYSGFPRPLARLKAAIAHQLPSIPKENPGSLWPKTTLAALKDGQRLDRQQLNQLLDLCCTASAQAELSAVRLPVRAAAVAVYLCRSLEKLLLIEETPLASRGQEEECWDVDSLDIAPEEAKRVEEVIAESESESYWYAASKDGNRESHYRGYSFGCTVMMPIGKELSEGRSQNALRLSQAIANFQRSVETLLPGAYAWLNPSSYHVTLRAIH